MEQTVSNSDIDVQELLDKYQWMIRPCDLYDEEYSDCKSFWSRVHQKFIFGEMQDCTQWKHDYDNCKKWAKYKNPRALKDLIDSELRKREQRLQSHYANNTWQRRTEPPANWNSPLPPWIEERRKRSSLAASKDEQPNNSFCSIS